MTNRLPWTGGLATLAAGILLTASVSAQAPEPVTLPGRGVGRIFLGMQRADVTRSLSKPRATYYPRIGKGTSLPSALHGAYVTDEWVSKNRAYSLQVTYRRDRVVQIRTDNPKFFAANAVSTNATFAEIRRRFPEMTVHSYLLTDADAVTFYADSVSRGIAFETETQDDLALADQVAAVKPLALIVHEPGVPVLPLFSASVGGRDDRGEGIKCLRAWFAEP